MDTEISNSFVKLNDEQKIEYLLFLESDINKFINNVIIQLYPGLITDDITYDNSQHSRDITVDGTYYNENMLNNMMSLIDNI